MLAPGVSENEEVETSANYIFFMQTILLVFGNFERDLGVVEWMSGEGHFQKQRWQSGKSSLGFEIRDDAIRQNFNGAEGFIEAMILVMRSERFSLQHWDTVCSNWVWVPWHFY